MSYHIALPELFAPYCYIELQYQLFADIDGICNTGKVIGLKIVYIVIPIFLIIHIVLSLDMAESFRNDVRYNTMEVAIGNNNGDIAPLGHGDGVTDQRFELTSQNPPYILGYLYQPTKHRHRDWEN